MTHLKSAQLKWTLYEWGWTMSMVTYSINPYSDMSYSSDTRFHKN